MLRFAAAGIFLVAAFSKIFSFSGLVFTLTRLGWFPPQVVPTVAVLVIIAELFTGCWLLSAKATLVSWGSLTGMVLAVTFITVHATLMARGVDQVCSCLGLLFQPSPTFMFGLNTVLLTVCALVFQEARTLLASGMNTRQLLSVRGQFARGVFCSALLLTSSLQVAQGRKQTEQDNTGEAVPQLHYGQMAPDFALRLTDGKIISPYNASNKWTLLSFVQTGCEPCHDDLNELSRWYPKQRDKLNAVAVVVGKGLLQSPETTARRYAQKMQLPMPVACDADSSVSKRYMGGRVQTPFHVLLDEKGRVRMVQAGRDEIEDNTRPALIQVVDNTINGVPMDFDLRAFQSGGAHGQPVPDGNIYLQGKEVKLSSLWRRGPLVLSFALLDCHGCDERLAIIKRAVSNSPKVQVLQLYLNTPEARIAAQRYPDLGPNVLIGADKEGTLARKYSVHFAPSTFVIADGKMLHVSRERAPAFDLERAVAQLATSSASKSDALDGLGQLAKNHS